MMYQYVRGVYFVIKVVFMEYIVYYWVLMNVISESCLQVFTNGIDVCSEPLIS